MSPFPPGSLGAQQAGCVCESPEDLHPLCEQHGIAVQVMAQMEHAERVHWELKKAKAKHRFRVWFPVSVMVSLTLSLALGQLADPIGRGLSVGIVCGAFCAWLCWNRP